MEGVIIYLIKAVSNIQCRIRSQSGPVTADSPSLGELLCYVAALCAISLHTRDGAFKLDTSTPLNELPFGHSAFKMARGVVCCTLKEKVE